MALIFDGSGLSATVTAMPVNSWNGSMYATSWASSTAPPQEQTMTSPSPISDSGTSVMAGSVVVGVAS